MCPRWSDHVVVACVVWPAVRLGSIWFFIPFQIRLLASWIPRACWCPTHGVMISYKWSSLDGQRQRVPELLTMASRWKRLEEDLCWNRPSCSPDDPIGQETELNWTEHVNIVINTPPVVVAVVVVFLIAAAAAGRCGSGGFRVPPSSLCFLCC